MSDAIFQSSTALRGSRSKFTSQRLPLAVGLAFGLCLSLAMWSGIVWLVVSLFA
jgi:hypothetical protein